MPRSLKLALRIALFGLTLVAFLPRLDAGIQILAVTHATDFTIGIAVPGSLATVFCTGLTGIQGVISAAGSPLPRELAGVSMSIDGRSVPLLALVDLGGYQQINFQVPWERAAGAPTLTVSQGQEIARSGIVSTAPWPVFFTHPDGSIVAQHIDDYQLVTRDRPARPGEWIVAYATNLGPVLKTPPTGVASPFDPLSPLAPVPPAEGAGVPSHSLIVRRPDQPVDFYTEAAEMTYIGLVPGAVGLYQVNFRVPDSFPSGDAAIYVRKNVDCGFFFLQGCGRGLVFTLSVGAKLPISD